MEIIADPKPQSGKFICIEHKGERIEFYLTFFKVSNVGPLFLDLNNYWKYRAESGGARESLDRLFDLYKQARKIVSPFTMGGGAKELRPIVAEILEFHSHEAVSLWMNNWSNICHPHLDNENSKQYRREQTYNSEEYRDLVAMSILLKAIVPIWGEYVTREQGVVNDVSSTKMMRLLEGTNLMSSPAYQRFVVFINALTETVQVTPNAVFAGIPSTQLSKWVINRVMVDKVALITPTHERDPDERNPINLVANIHRYVRQIVDQLNMPKKNAIVDKADPQNSGKSEEDNTSIAEGYTISEDLPEVTKIYYDYFSKDMRTLALQAKERIDLDLCKELVNTNMRRRSFAPTEWQFKTVSLLMAHVVGSRSILYTNRVGAMNILSIAQVMAFELGAPNIAALIGGDVVHRLENSAASSQIKEQQTRVLDDLYTIRRKFKRAKQGGQPQAKNPGILAAETLAEHYGRCTWAVHVPKAIESELTLQTLATQKGFVVPAQFRQELAELIIRIRTLNEVN